jgi:hypothetical protein
MSENTEKVIDVAADAAGEMAQQLEKMEQTIRSLNRAKVGFYFLGMAIGGATAAVITWKVAYSRAETKYSKIADDEIAEMRRHYLEKGRALESEAAKRPVEEIVRDRGYGTPPVGNAPPPMAIQPPSAVVESEDEVAGEPPDDESDPPEVKNIFQETEATVTHEWDWHEERRHRSPDIPYVIHYDEREEMEGYSIETLTYYEGDDVLCNERDEIIDPDYQRDQLVGEKNLERFGHGSGDPVIVYIRNDKLEMVYEVVRSPHHYAEEVHGFHHSGYGKNLERMRVRERDEQEE